MTSTTRSAHRSFTGHHALLPATNSAHQRVLIPVVPTQTLLVWTFGRGTVLWRIWPAVLLHTAFAAVVVSISMKTRFDLSIPNVMLTVLGVVIGFVISYRAISGYDRYWQGRSASSDIMRSSRTFGRLIWFHVPLRPMISTPDTDPGKTDKGKDQDKEIHELRHVMAEKYLALDLVEAFSVAVKHHLRGEIGIYYEDLYPLVRPLHDHHRKQQASAAAQPAQVPQMCPAEADHASELLIPKNPIIPPINAYGTFSSSASHNLRSSSSSSSFSSHSSHRGDRPLLPGSAPPASGVMNRVSSDLIPFSSIFGHVSRAVQHRFSRSEGYSEVTYMDVETGSAEGDISPRNLESPNDETCATAVPGPRQSISQYTWAESGRTSTFTGQFSFTHKKHRPRIAGGGENMPLEIVRRLSHWLSVLEARGTIPGNTLGGMFSCLSSFEDSLAALERILTTPLPFVYSVHIRHTVWLYLFFLPFQLVDQFRWYAIPGVCIAAFIYLGFLAAGEEIEQPFGYDENDLDLDMFCRAVVHADFEHLRRTPCMNALTNVGHRSEDGDTPVVTHKAFREPRKVAEMFGAW
ncbi:UPF0187-domain-containing protein [Panus rudis PR-1116 ss-1]|nr:UPF0187-domain-containing protein [Panus rudis PR-1116 ss-1]